MSRSKSSLLLMSFIAAMTLGGCGDGSGNDPSASTGTVNLGVTDAPVDGATHVVVEFTGVEVKPQGASAISFIFPAPRQIDLLALQGGDSELLLVDTVLPAGQYEFVRLMVNADRNASDSYIDLEDGSRHALFIPSGNQSGLKLVSGFTVAAGGTSNFTIDFDLRKSIHNPAGQDGAYLLRPALRIIDNNQVGSISGTVAVATASATGCSPAVYVYSGAGVIANDEGSSTAPLTTALVELDTATGTYRYIAAFLPVGSYTTALTCEAVTDDPASDDAVSFTNPTDATVASGQTTTVNFP